MILQKPDYNIDMEYSFPRYLLSKQTVDDRALNKDVLAALQYAVRPAPARGFENPLSIVEVGAGIGTMLMRLLRWNILPAHVEYTLVDELRENTDYALNWIPSWARENGYQVESVNANTLRLSSASIRLTALESAEKSVLVHIIQSDIFDHIRLSASKSVPPSDLLIAHAFLDLLPMPESLPKLFSLLRPDGLAWLTINFDGVTTFEPATHISDLPSQDGSESADESAIRFNHPLDDKIERLYHHTMDTRPTGGDSQSGRHLFGHLQQAGAEIVSAGASDWVVYPDQGQYPADEAYFLHFILHFFETALSNHPDLDQNVFAAWLTERRDQIDRGQLIYIAHQMDFLCQVPSPLQGEG